MNQVRLGEYRDEALALVVSGQYAAARRVAEHMLRYYPDYVTNGASSQGVLGNMQQPLVWISTRL
jgi:hypothetical protein